MTAKRSAGERLFDAFNALLMCLIIFITVYPMYYVVIASVSLPSRLMANRSLLLAPLGFTTGAYQLVMQNEMVWIGYRNTLVYLAVGTALNMILTTMGAYVLSRKPFFLKKLLLWAALIPMFFSGGLIPFYLTVKGYGMLDSLWAMVLPGAVSTYNLLVLRTAFEGIPAEMEESAKLDGANDFVVLVRIYLPLLVPSLAVILMFYAVGHWNGWFNAMVFLRSRERYPLQLILREILIVAQGDYRQQTTETDFTNINEIIKYATIVVTTLPILFVYPFLQKYFVKGVLIGAVKG